MDAWGNISVVSNISRSWSEGRSNGSVPVCLLQISDALPSAKTTWKPKDTPIYIEDCNRSVISTPKLRSYTPQRPGPGSEHPAGQQKRPAFTHRLTLLVPCPSEFHVIYGSTPFVRPSSPLKKIPYSPPRTYHVMAAVCMSLIRRFHHSSR